MSIVPLDLQRRCEQRWAARFARQAPEPLSQKSEHEKQGQQPGETAKDKSTTGRRSPQGTLPISGTKASGAERFYSERGARDWFGGAGVRSRDPAAAPRSS